MANTAKRYGWVALPIGGALAAIGASMSCSDGLKKSGGRVLDRTESSLTGVGKRAYTGTMITGAQLDLTRVSCVTSAILLTEQ
jgi:hypothetical protein